MTTNVFDGKVAFMATDSRWSIQRGRWLLYLDDTNFDKIEISDDAAFMFAGRGIQIELWKHWIRSKPKDKSNMPAVEGISVTGVNLKTKERYTEGKSITHDDSIFAGSGARYAVQCWNKNRCARKAVDTAKTYDCATGGDLKYFDFDSGEKKLGGSLFAPATIADIDQALATRGMIMDITAKGTPIPFKLSELAAAQDEIQSIREDIAAGTLSAQAPCDAMYSEWSPEEKERLTGFLGRAFGWQ